MGRHLSTVLPVAVRDTCYNSSFNCLFTLNTQTEFDYESNVPISSVPFDLATSPSPPSIDCTYRATICKCILQIKGRFVASSMWLSGAFVNLCKIVHHVCVGRALPHLHLSSYCPALQTNIPPSLSSRRNYMQRADYKAMLARFMHSLPMERSTKKHSIMLARLMNFTKRIHSTGILCRVFRPRSRVSISEIVAWKKQEADLFLKVFCQKRSKRLGGAARAKYASREILEPYLCSPLPADRKSARYLFVDYVERTGLLVYPVEKYVHTDIPLPQLLAMLPKSKAHQIGQLHGMCVITRSSSQLLSREAVSHDCTNCSYYYTIFSIEATGEDLSLLRANKHCQGKQHEVPDPVGKQSKCKKQSSEACPPFESPPAPLDNNTRDRIIRDTCRKMEPHCLEEGGCAMCGELKPLKDLSRLKSIKNLLHILAAPGVTRKERKSESDAIAEFTGPVLDYSCCSVCQQCRACL